MKLKSKSWCVTSPGSAVWTPGWAVPSECGRSSEPAKIDFDSWNVKFWPRSMEQPILCSVCRQSQQHTGERAIWVAILKQSSWHGIRFCSSAVQPFKLSGLHFMRRRHSNCLVFNSCCAWRHSNSQVFISCLAWRQLKLSDFCLVFPQIWHHHLLLVPRGLLHALEAWQNFYCRNCWIMNGKIVYLVGCEYIFSQAWLSRWKALVRCMMMVSQGRQSINVTFYSIWDVFPKITHQKWGFHRSKQKFESTFQ